MDNAPAATAGLEEGGVVGDGDQTLARDREAGMRDKRERREGRRESEEVEQVVYYYDVATIWVRPVDVKVR